MQVKKTFENRRGSALLIVLGMLSFMVVSAVGFSIYMRQGRLPSSYLRRNIASRYLVKAALANAIEDLEGGFMSKYEIGEDDRDDPSVGRFYGIHDDPYPGVGADMHRSGQQTGSREFPKVNATDPADTYQVSYMENGDFWFHRVFCPFGPLPHPNSNQESLERPPLTVPTLTLEALAYLPPAIMDDVRKASRLTRTALWHALPYEAGRYAYTAVNVSDLFDINRLQVDEPRNSGRDRISLVSLCANAPDQALTVNQGSVDALANVLEAMESKTVNGNVTPFTSLADFNLVASGANELGFAPLMDYIGKTSSNLLRDDPMTANALFVADTWFPITNAPGRAAYDLAAGHQPFKPGAFGATPAAGHFMEVLLQKNDAKNGNDQDSVGDIFEKNLGLGLVCLYDYLDRDQQPISLCLPTTEAVPMVVGVSAPAGLGVTIGQIGPDETGQWNVPGTVMVDGNPQPETRQVTRTCKKMGITSFAQSSSVMVKILTAYPFLRMGVSTTKRRQAKTFKARGVMRVYLALPGMRSRLSNSPIRALSDPGAASLSGEAGVVDGVATFVSQTKTISAFTSDVQTWQDALDDSVELEFTSMNVSMPLYWTVEEAYSGTTTTGAFTPNDPNLAPRSNPIKSLGNLQADSTALRPLDADGKLHADWQANGPWNLNTPGDAGAADMSALPIVSGGAKFRLQASVWLQILDENDKVVDMAPACFGDDEKIYGLMSAGNVPAKCGDHVPILNFQAKGDVTYADIDTTLTQAPAFNGDASCWGSLYCVDPRYNFAPEDWYAAEDLQVLKTTWHDNVLNNYLGKDGRDRDIFMFVSDQEYLQDIGELQFLPVLDEMDGSANFMDGAYQPSFAGDTFATRRSPGGVFSNKDRFWRTYTAFDNGDGYDPIYALPYSGGTVRFHSNVTGFRINPYTTDNRMMNAALVGTPFDYYVASTNELSEVKRLQNITFEQMQSTFGFGDSQYAKITSQELDEIIGVIQDRFATTAASGSSDWLSGWNALIGSSGADVWQENSTSAVEDQNKKFLGVDLSQALYNVDRKFLCSFWRECFDNRQQLFLIFVRAEPTSIGGGAAGAISSTQLGGRAVALVWRDPSVPTGGGSRTLRTAINNRDQFRDFKRDNAPHKTRILFYHQFD